MKIENSHTRAVGTNKSQHNELHVLAAMPEDREPIKERPHFDRVVEATVP
jgi:hypothetical protein